MRILVAEDQPELRRMLVKNLTAAGYAVDGVPDGEEALAYLDAADYDVAMLAVRDDGIGIAPEQQERIWQRFYQVDPARSGGEGTGLGLYMVRQIARLHGGTAEVNSAPGQGSTFTVRIPAHRK